MWASLKRRAGSPSPNRNSGENSINDSKGPRALQKAVDRCQRARPGKRQNPPRATVLKGVGDEHQRYSEQSE